MNEREQLKLFAEPTTTPLDQQQQFDPADAFVHELIAGREPWPVILEKWGMKWR